MCNLGEGLWEEAHAEGLATGLATGRAEGLAAGRADMIQKMLKKGMTPEEVAALTELSAEEVEKIKNTDMVSV